MKSLFLKRKKNVKFREGKRDVCRGSKCQFLSLTNDN